MPVGANKKKGVFHGANKKKGVFHEQSHAALAAAVTYVDPITFQVVLHPWQKITSCSGAPICDVKSQADSQSQVLLRCKGCPQRR